jgi:mutator protein MutT
MTSEEPKIKKAGAVILDEKRRLLIVKPKDKDFYLFVGGKIEQNETPKQSLFREIEEELGIKAQEAEFYFKSPIEQAQGQPAGVTVQIWIYLVKIKDQPKASREIEKLHWLTKDEFENKKFEIGTILEEHTIPRLIKDGLM